MVTAVKTTGNNGNGFKPGKSGNPRGRPRRAEAAAQFVRDFLTRRIPLDDGEYTTRLLQLLEGQLEAARGGNVAAAQLLLDRAYGKLIEPKAHIGDEGGPIRIVLRWEHDRASD